MQAILAQAVQEVSSHQAIINNGLLGTVILWLFTRGEKLCNEIKMLANRIDAMTRATLVDVISRESSGPHAQKQAREIMAEIEFRTK